MEKTTFEILNFIHTSGPVSGANISATYNLTRRGLEHHIQNIRILLEGMFHDAITLQASKRGYEIVGQTFTKGERLFFEQLIDHQTNFNDQEKQRLKSLLHPLEMIAHPTKPMSDELLLKLNVLTSAIDEGRCVEFNYIDYDCDNEGHLIEKMHMNGNKRNDKTAYIVSPGEIVYVRDHFYLYSYYPKRENVITVYRIDRMRHVIPSKAIYSHPQTTIEQYEQKKAQQMMAFTGDDEVETIVLRFKASLFNTMVDEFGQNGYYEKDILDVKNYRRLTLHHYMVSEGFINFMTMMAGQVEILEPERLRLRLKQRLQNMMSTYMN